MDKPGKGSQRSARGKGRGKRKLWPLYPALGLIAALLVVIVADLPRHPQPPVVLPPLVYSGLASSRGGAPKVLPAAPAAEHDPSGSQVVAMRSTGVEPRRVRGTLIVVIDDVGYNLEELAPFLSMPLPLTLSVLPQLPDTARAYQLITAAGKLAILHQPMEALAQINPGPGTITATMTRAEVDDVLTKDLAELPGVKWMNNHEGSKITSDRTVMGWVLTYVQDHHLQFLDSRTTGDSVVEAAAVQMGMPYFERNSPFLDDSVSRPVIMAAIEAGTKVAERDGYSVMIGHVWDHDLPGILSAIYPKLLSAGFRFETVGELPALVKDRESTRH